MPMGARGSVPLRLSDDAHGWRIDVVVVLLAHVSVLRVASVDVYSIGKAQTLAALERPTAVFTGVALKSASAKYVGGHETIVPDVPVGGISEVFRPVKDGYSYLVGIHYP